MVLVGRVGRPHGLRGWAVINPDTDFVEERFAAGGLLWCKGLDGPKPVSVAEMRIQRGRPVVRFAGIDTVESVQRLVGHELRVEAGALRALKAGSYYHHELVGCVVETGAGQVVGTVVAVEGSGEISRLVVAGSAGDVQVPFAEDICGEVDTVGRRIRIDPPEGLLELNAR
jgi:16S rRNA processing protein RimM